MSSRVRRVVTGHDASGKAIVLADGPSPSVVRSPIQPGLAFHEIWNTGRSPVVITSGFDDPTIKRTETRPPAAGTIIRIVELPPEGPDGPQLSDEQSRRLFSAVGLEGNVDLRRSARHPLMHRTESIDYAIVLAGEIVLLLDDSEVVLKAGDVVVQRGTIHAWTNRTDTISTVAFILVDGRFDDDLARTIARHDAEAAGT